VGQSAAARLQFEVQHHHVRPGSGQPGHQAVNVTGVADHFDIRLRVQCHGETHPHHRVIVCHQHPDYVFRACFDSHHKICIPLISLE
jgi:hypothetical protein